ncbi:MAG: hypothetical protein INR69_17390 [Mucilaginibacter polytrichastri]|nr:hypothetical protein [Mucilaginibacter polytrichastri]
MHTIQLDKKTYTGPSAWKELNQISLRQVAAGTLLSAEAGRLYLISALYGIPRKELDKLLRSQLEQLYPLLDFLSESNSIGSWMINRVGKLFGPSGCLSDLTAEEWMYTEYNYEQWLHGQDERYETGLAAVLMREKTGDKRAAFDAGQLTANETILTKESRVFRHAILINYAGCRNKIISLHRNVWKPPVEGETAEQDTAKYTNWRELCLSIAPGPFGTFEQVLKAPLWDVLKHMDRQAKLAEEMEARR